MLSHSAFVLLARRGIVLAEIRNVATTLGYHVVGSPKCGLSVCVIVACVLIVCAKDAALVPLPSARDLRTSTMRKKLACHVFGVSSISLLLPIRGALSSHASPSSNVYALVRLTTYRILLDRAFRAHEHC